MQAHSKEAPGRSPRFYAALSVAAAVVTITLKTGAYLLTGSVGLFSDAAESLVNLVAALGALWALTVAARPPDEEHAFGHTKAEYFSGALESVLIVAAAVGIAVTAVGRLLEPQPLENVGLGLAVSLAAAGINGGVGLVLLRAGRRERSAALRADGRHLLTDVWTSVGVVAGVFLVWLTGWLVLDPLIALAVTAYIVWIGFRLLNDTAHGLLDTALPPEELEVITGVQARYEEAGIRFHALRTRSAGQRRFVSMHVLVPGEWSVQHGHDLSERIEADIIRALPMTTVTMHLEPIEDHVSWQDQDLDRSSGDGAENESY
ncbi:MAG: cation diffusion facilitator family transporter [Actinomycetota bacterium]|nr:cation diffusion facilitator family transporter [Actinomycetota bacterium]